MRNPMSGAARVIRWCGRWGSSAALLICVAEVPRAAAETPPAPGVIQGSVRTQGPTPLAGVDIKVIDAKGRIVADVVSDNEGRFQVAGLTAGTYRVMSALAGFETTTQSVVVTNEDGAVITVELAIARFADTIDVVGETSVVSNGRTLAPVEAIASRALDEFVPGQGFQGAIRMEFRTTVRRARATRLSHRMSRSSSSSSSLGCGGAGGGGGSSAGIRTFR